MEVFLRRLAHELRTPLASLRMLRELLATRPALEQDDKAAGYLERLEETVRDLMDLVDQVEGLGRLEGDDDEPTPMPQEAFLHRLRASLPEDVAMRGLPEEEGKRPSGGEGRTVDLRWVDGVLRPLVQALQDAKVGALEVSVAVDPRGGLRITVRDSGPAPEGLETFFEPFAHSDLRTRRGRGGRGLVLCQLERRTGLWGGRLTVAAARPGGALFTLTLPESAEPQDPTSRAPAPAGGEC